MLTAEELSWVELLTKSSGLVRELLLSDQRPTESELFTLINRADALMFHLNKRTEANTAAVARAEV